MKDVLIVVYNYINSLSLIDIAIFCVLMVLAILIISLINTLKGYTIVKKDVKQEKKEEIQQELEINEVKEIEKKQEIKQDDIFDLSAVTQELERAEKMNIDLTPYEAEQEEKAIISYDELLQARNDLKINYEDEISDDGIVVKKVNMENMTSYIENDEEKADTNVKVISYEKEEAFLESLKQLQKLLNS
ncbi:MAG: hypothetical protein ACI31M_04310 [Bacilli bacterium]